MFATTSMGRSQNGDCWYNKRDGTIILFIRAIALVVEAACTSETSVNFYQTTQRKTLEDSHLPQRYSVWYIKAKFPNFLQSSGFLHMNYHYIRRNYSQIMHE
jgi:hypothetical protein